MGSSGQSSSTSNTSQTQNTTPWAPTQGVLTGVLGATWTGQSEPDGNGIRRTATGLVRTAAISMLERNWRCCRTLLNGGGPDRTGMVS